MKIRKLFYPLFYCCFSCRCLQFLMPRKNVQKSMEAVRMKFSLATGSPGELGLLKVLGDSFSKDMNTTLCWIKAGTGDSLKFLKEKSVDMIMVHAPDAEKKAVIEGWATKRTLIGSNEFYILGPPDDPAKDSRI